jgi:putative aldouronate transport system permease protein
VVLGGIFIALLSPSTGFVNMALKALGMQPVFFMSTPGWWTVMFVVSSIWQSAGWGTIIYLAAISTIDSEMYEAATIDGAGRWSQVWRITLPNLLPTIAIMLILRAASIMDVGFEQVYSLQNDAVRIETDVLSTYVYRMGIQSGLFSYTTAVGLFQSVVGMIVVLATNRAIKAMGQEGLW